MNWLLAAFYDAPHNSGSLFKPNLVHFELPLTPLPFEANPFPVESTYVSGEVGVVHASIVRSVSNKRDWSPFLVPAGLAGGDHKVSDLLLSNFLLAVEDRPTNRQMNSLIVYIKNLRNPGFLNAKLLRDSGESAASATTTDIRRGIRPRPTRGLSHTRRLQAHRTQDSLEGSFSEIARN